MTGFNSKRDAAADKLQEPVANSFEEYCKTLHPLWNTHISRTYAEQFFRAGQSAQPAQDPVAHPVISGALFDFMGWLTSRKERIVLSSADNTSPAVEAITEFARMRNLSLDDAKVQDWRITPPKRPWVGLTDEEAKEVLISVDHETKRLPPGIKAFARAIEAKLKDKNI